jgi:hypothetical protein
MQTTGWEPRGPECPGPRPAVAADLAVTRCRRAKRRARRISDMNERVSRRRRLSQALLAAATGVFCSGAVWQSSINHAGWVEPARTIPAVVIGCVALPVALSLTGLVERLAGPSH